MKNIYKIIIIAALGVYLSLAINCVKANADLQDLNLSLNNKNILLVKTVGDPAVYFIINNKRHKILSAEVFVDYGFKWNDVKIITNKKLNQYPPAKIVKTADDPKVYYIHEILNQKKIIPNAEIFLAYENKWDDIITVSQKDLDSYSDINLVKSVNSPKIYELKDGVKKAIANPQEFISKGYKWNEVVIVKDAELDYYPIKIADNNEKVVDNAIGSSESEKNQSNKTPFLSVKTIKQNKETIVPSGTVVSMLKLKLTAGLAKPVNISSLKISKVKGLSLIENIIVSDENNNVLGNVEMKNENSANVKLKPELYIAPNGSAVISIKGRTKNEDHIVYEQLFIESAQDISSDVNIEGSFPLMGDRIKVIPGDRLIGKVEVDTVIVSDGLRNVYLGETDCLITKFIFRETTGNEDVDLKMLKITNEGSGYVKFANVDLVDQDNHVIATVANPTGSDIVFDMTRSPCKIPKGLSRTLGVKADIISGSGGSVKFEIESENDILAAGKEYLFDLTVSSREEGGFPIGRGKGNNVNRIKINDVEVTVYKSDLSPVGGLVAGSKEQPLGIFNIRVNGSAINYTSATLQIISGGKINLEGDLKVRDYKTKKILGQIQASSAINGAATVNFNIFPKIETKQTFAFEVLVNIDDEATILDTYQLKITGIGFQVSGSNLDNDINREASGNVLSVKRSSLTINSDSSLKDAKISAGKTAVLIGGFILQAGVAEDLTVNSFNISEVSGYSALRYSEGYSNLKIRVNKTDYAAYQAPAGGSFIVNKPFTIMAGKSVAIAIYIDTTSLVDGDKIKLAINNVNAYGKISGLQQIQTGSNIQSSMTEFKQSRLIITKNSEMDDTVISAGTSNQKIASFSFKNEGFEDIAIKNFTLAAEGPNEISYDNGYSNMKTTGNHVVQKPIAGGNVFSNFTIKAGATTIIDVYITTNTNVLTSGNNFKLVLKDIQVASGVFVDGNNVVGQNVNVVGN